MSGTFNDIDVPPTLVSFAVDVAKQQDMRVELARLPAVCYSIENYFLGGRIYYV